MFTRLSPGKYVSHVWPGWIPKNMLHPFTKLSPRKSVTPFTKLRPLKTIREKSSVNSYTLFHPEISRRNLLWTHAHNFLRKVFMNSYPRNIFVNFLRSYLEGGSEQTHVHYFFPGYFSRTCVGHFFPGQSRGNIFFISGLTPPCESWKTFCRPVLPGTSLKTFYKFITEGAGREVKERISTGGPAGKPLSKQRPPRPSKSKHGTTYIDPCSWSPTERINTHLVLASSNHLNHDSYRNHIRIT